MRQYKKIPESTGNILWDWIATSLNNALFKKIVISVATREHERTSRQIHISEMFGAFVIFDSRERDDINKTGKFGKMQLIDLYKASIWNSNLIH